MSEFWTENLDVGYYDKIVKDGIKKGRGVQSYWHITTLNKVSKYLNSEIEHLDYACGPGTLIGLFSNSNSTGVDLSENQIMFAKNNYKLKGNFYNIEEFENNHYIEKFELITILGLVEFLTNDEVINLINNLEKCLKPGGKIILTTPNFKGFMKILEIILNKFGNVDYSKEHINKFNIHNLKTIFEKELKFEVNLIKFLNMSIFFSFLNHKLASIIESFVAVLFNNYFGSLILVELSRKNNK